MPSWLCSLNEDFNLVPISAGSSLEDEEQEENGSGFSHHPPTPSVTVIFIFRLNQIEGGNGKFFKNKKEKTNIRHKRSRKDVERSARNK